MKRAMPATTRLHVAGNPLDAPRPSGTVKAVAEVIGAHPATVDRLVDSGALEGYQLGKRIRVYWDSVADYQGRNGIKPTAKAPDSPPPKHRPKPASIAAHRAAVASMDARRARIYAEKSGQFGKKPPKN